MAEIEYNRENKKLRFYHDNKEWTFEDLKKHFKENGHPRENISYAVPKDVYFKCKKIVDTIDRIFDEKGIPRNIRQIL